MSDLFVPARLHLTLARAAEATLRVIPQVRGAPARGYALAGVAVDPSSVHVRGPRSTIERRDTVETAPVDAYPVRAGGVQVTVEIRKEHER